MTSEIQAQPPVTPASPAIPLSKSSDTLATAQAKGADMAPSRTLSDLTGPTSAFEKLRITIAILLLAFGFGLTAYGWACKDDHFYHLGLTLGPAGLVVLVFEYLVRISLETRHVQQMMHIDKRHTQELGGLREETITSLQKTAEELRQIATFDLDRGKLGLVGIYASRADAVRYAIAQMIETEKEAVYIVGSTIFGLRCDVKDGPGQPVYTTADLVARLAKRRSAGCKIFLLLTAPKKIIERHEQEAAVRSAERGTIASELRDACALLAANGLTDCIRLYDGSPTSFTIVFKGQRRMIVNPYPYQGEAYNSWAIMIEDRENGIYKPFFENHVEGPWNNEKLSRKLTKNFTKELQEAEAAEKKFRIEAESLMSKEAKKKEDQLLALLSESEPN